MVGGVVGSIKAGLMDGVTVLAGEIVQNKTVMIAEKFIPAMGPALVRTAVVNLSVAVAGSMVAKKFAGAHARMLVAGMFARAAANILANTPAAALLGDGVAYPDGHEDMAAYPSISAGMAAYPNLATADVSFAEH
jgi:hypothetical protein